MDSSMSDSSDSNQKKPFKCTIKGCQATFSKNSKLVFHIRKHTNERPFVCDESDCDKSYTNSSHLRRHKKISHQEKESQQIPCGIEGCDLILANKYSLKKHQNRKHNSVYSFNCSECSQGFHRKKQLQQHMYIHTGDAPFKCDLCTMCFTVSRDLNKHKRSHRTYECECGTVFHRWSLMLTHKKECKKTKYVCETCNKSFFQLSNFKTHALVHQDESKKEVYVCDYPDCKRFYFYKKNLVFHVNSFHKKIASEKIPCTQAGCSLLLKNKKSLKRHLERHFQWIKNKPTVRNTRKDKGIPKKSMASFMSGITGNSDSESSDTDFTLPEEEESDLETICNDDEDSDEDRSNQVDIEKPALDKAATEKATITKIVEIEQPVLEKSPTNIEIVSQPNSLWTDINHEDDLILKQCDIVLKKLHEELCRCN